MCNCVQDNILGDFASHVGPLQYRRSWEGAPLDCKGHPASVTLPGAVTQGGGVGAGFVLLLSILLAKSPLEEEGS